MCLEVFGISYEGGGRYDRGQGAGSKVAGLSAFGASEASLDGIVLVEFGLDVVIEGLQFFCQGVDEVSYGFVGTVLDFVPLEGAEVLVDRFWGPQVRLSSSNRVKSVSLLLSLIVFCCSTFLESLARTAASDSLILPTTLSAAELSLAKSSAC